MLCKIFIPIVLVSSSVDGFISDNLIGKTREIRNPKNNQFSKHNVLPVRVEEASSLLGINDVSSMINMLGQFSKDPCIESNFLNDMGHTLVDGLTLLSPSCQVKSKVITILGRLSFIASDYIPDHFIKTDELFFQILMLAVSLSTLSYDLFLIGTKLYSSNFRDKRIYVRFFRNAGLSWNKYKLFFSSAFQWVEIKPFTTIQLKSLSEKESSFLWVYDGNIEAGVSDSIMEQFERNSVLENDSSNLILRSGKMGASLLQVNLNKMSELMNKDDILNDSCRDVMRNLRKGTMSKFYGT